MGDPEKENIKSSRAGKYLSRVAMALVCLFALIVLAVTVYLSTPLPAQQVSRLVTSYLHQGFTVDSLHTTGGTVYLKGVRLDNPPGFTKGSMAAADSVVIAPRWGDLVSGRQGFRLIALDGIRVSLEKNRKGDWNFGPLQRLLASRKASPTETRIREFSVRNGSVTVGGQGVQGIDLKIFNLTTKGSLDSKLDLAFEDAAHSRYSLKGRGHGGADPEVDLTLSAPVLSLKGLASLLKLKNTPLFEAGTGNLQMQAGLHKKELSASGSFGFSQMQYSAARKRYPVTGSLEFAADYDLARDAARLQNCVLTLKDLVQVHAGGTVQGLKKERNFAMDLGFSELDLAVLNNLLPGQTRKDLVFGGRLGCQTLHLAGNASKVTGASGTLQLRGGRLAKGGRLLVAGLSGDIGFSRAGEGVLAKGRLALSGPQGDALLESLDMPFNLSLSRQLKPVRAEISPLSARIMAVPFFGRLAFDASKENPLAASLKVPATKLSALGTLWGRYDLAVKSGTASFALEASGQSLQQLGATVGVNLADVQGSRGKNPLAVKKGVASARVRRGEGHLQVQGEADLKGVFFNGKGGDARFKYRVADQMAYLDGAEVSAAGTQVAIAHLSAALPVRGNAAQPVAFPVSLAFDGCTVKRGGLEVDSLSGRVRGNLQSDSAGRWLEGSADLASGRVAWQGKVVAAPVLGVAFSRAGTKGDLKGQLLGGALTGSVSGNPFATEAGASFDLHLKDAQLAAAAPFLPKGSKTVPSDGLVDLQVKGAYSRPAGLSCRFDAKGSRIALTGAGAKTILSGAAFSLAGALAGDKLSIGAAVLSPGPGVALKVTGELVRPFSEGRTGNLNFSLPETAVGSLVDPLINLLPRAIQEATLDGTLAAQGKVELQGGGKLLEGALIFKGGRFEVAQQKLVVSDINGRFPFSLDLSGKTGGKPPSAMAFSRANYPLLLTQLRSKSAGGEVLTVGKIGFGPLELGTLTMHATAKGGITEISSLTTSLYEGALLGKGYISLREGLGYRGDLLLNDLSLKRLCSTFPGIKGYISGRVDGVFSISGGAHGLAGISGFTDLWAREGSQEKMLVSKEFLQRLAKQKLGGFFFRSDRSYDEAEINAIMQEGYLTFEALKILHTNFFGVRDLNVSIAPTQNRIALDHLLESIKQAATRGKAATTGTPAPAGEQTPVGEQAPAAGEQAPPATQEFKWGE